MYDEGLPPPDFPVGGESSVHRCTLERPAVTQVEPPGTRESILSVLYNDHVV